MHDLEIQYRKPCQLLLLLYSVSQGLRIIATHTHNQKLVWLEYNNIKKRKTRKLTF